MRKKQVLHYYVEGEDEKSLLEALKRDLGCIETGKVDIMNVIQTRFTVARIRPLKPGTIVVLVYDTDVETNMEILQFNIEFLKKQTGIKEVICIPQVRNLEDELRNACDIKAVKPDPVIYQTICEKYDLVPEECVFLDDFVDNVQAAREFGMKAILFENYEQAKKELESLL